MCRRIGGRHLGATPRPDPRPGLALRGGGTAVNALPPLHDIDADRLRAAAAPRLRGRIEEVVGLLARARLPQAAVGDVVRVHADADRHVDAEVVGFRRGSALLIARGTFQGVPPSSPVERLEREAGVYCSDALVGRVLGPDGRPLDRDRGPVGGPSVYRPLHDTPPPALERPPIDTPLHVGVRAIDGLLTLGRGQRMGIFAGAGVGKSHLLGRLARSADADVRVLALVGERGREVADFLDRILPEEARRKTITIVATSDRSPIERMRAAYLAHTIAAHFARRGRSVLLLLDSLTRFAMAGREVGLAMGEPPATRGYPPTVFAELPRLLERAGTYPGGGSVTALYTVLVEGDDLRDPVADTTRAILDGHIVLSRDLAGRGHYPAIAVTRSISRIADHVLQPAHARVATAMRRLVAYLEEVDELRSIGAYERGTAPHLDFAVDRRDRILDFLRQEDDAATPFPETLRAMVALTEGMP
ncbi:MAG: FliI/YscN family ATPase [Deltaproteobacteria bacterium]|nr:MAG: FliI/YscN family ATPase [Deltaproteobacteria bacterium]